MAQPAPATAMPYAQQQIFDLLDRNHDGVVSRAEWQQAMGPQKEEPRCDWQECRNEARGAAQPSAGGKGRGKKGVKGKGKGKGKGKCKGKGKNNGKGKGFKGKGFKSEKGKQKEVGILDDSAGADAKRQRTEKDYLWQKDLA